MQKKNLKVNKIIKNIVYINNKALVTTKALILHYNLKENMEINEDTYESLFYDTITTYAYKRLTNRMYTEYELYNLLISKFDHKQIVENVVDNLKEKNYIDDVKYCEDYIRIKKYGKDRLEYELLKKGITKEVIKESIKLSEKNELEEIEKILKKISYKTKKQKITYLARRGYQFDDIFEALN